MKHRSKISNRFRCQSCEKQKQFLSEAIFSSTHKKRRSGEENENKIFLVGDAVKNAYMSSNRSRNPWKTRINSFLQSWMFWKVFLFENWPLSKRGSPSSSFWDFERCIRARELVGLPLTIFRLAEPAFVTSIGERWFVRFLEKSSRTGVVWTDWSVSSPMTPDNEEKWSMSSMLNVVKTNQYQLNWNWRVLNRILLLIGFDFRLNLREKENLLFRPCGNLVSLLCWDRMKTPLFSALKFKLELSLDNLFVSRILPTWWRRFCEFWEDSWNPVIPVADRTGLESKGEWVFNKVFVDWWWAFWAGRVFVWWLLSVRRSNLFTASGDWVPVREFKENISTRWSSLFSRWTNRISLCSSRSLDDDRLKNSKTNSRSTAMDVVWASLLQETNKIDQILDSR